MSYIVHAAQQTAVGALVCAALFVLVHLVVELFSIVSDKFSNHD